MSYRTPTNFQLAQGADAIIIGTVIGSEKRRVDGMFDESKIVIQPDITIKGAPLTTKVKMDGVLSGDYIKMGDEMIEVPDALPSNPVDIWRPHPEVWGGGCNRNTFNKGMKLVLFLKREGEKFRIDNPPFARSLEDVSSNDSLWAQAVREYVRLAKIPIEQRSSAFKEIIQKLRANNQSSLLADDLERQLLGCTGFTQINVAPSSSDAGISKEKCANPRWVSNLFNEMYYGQLDTPPTGTRAAAKPVADGKNVIILLAIALSISLTLCAYLVFRLRRRIVGK